jgi:hypothetical protein
LSTFILRGIPQRAKQPRSLCCTSPAGTWLKCPWGENGGPKDRPGGLVSDPQPGDVLTRSKALLLDGVHLPGVVGQAAAPRLLGGGPPRGRGRPGQAGEQPLDGALAGRGLVGQEAAEFDADAPGPPARPVLPEPDGELVPGQVEALVLAAAVVVREQGVAASLPLAEQPADGGVGQPEPAGDLRRGSALGQPKDGGTQLGGDGGWHGGLLRG